MTQGDPLPCPSCELADGRRLAYQCFGQPQGRPLYFFDGFPGCRLQPSLLHAQALAADVCLVAADRPEFGRSTAAPARTILGWANDVAQRQRSPARS